MEFTRFNCPVQGKGAGCLWNLLADEAAVVVVEVEELILRMRNECDCNRKKMMLAKEEEDDVVDSELPLGGFISD